MMRYVLWYQKPMSVCKSNNYILLETVSVNAGKFLVFNKERLCANCQLWVVPGMSEVPQHALKPSGRVSPGAKSQLAIILTIQQHRWPHSIRYCLICQNSHKEGVQHSSMLLSLLHNFEPLHNWQSHIVFSVALYLHRDSPIFISLTFQYEIVLRH